MNRFRKTRILLAALLWAWAMNPGALWACSVCFGDPDSAMSKGLAWGVLSLLGVVLMVLGGITTFFVYLAKRSPTDKIQ